MWSTVTGFSLLEHVLVLLSFFIGLPWCPGIDQSIYSTVDVLLIFFHLFAVINNAVVNICVQVLFYVDACFNLLLSIYLGMKLLRHICCLAF